MWRVWSHYVTAYSTLRAQELSGQVTVPQPPALTRQVAVQEEEAVAPEPPLTQAQMLRLQRMIEGALARS